MSHPGEPPTPPAEGRTDPPIGWPQPTVPVGGTASPVVPGWEPPPPQPYAGWPQGASPDHVAAKALGTARTALGWAIGAAVGAGLAMVGMVVALVVGGLGVAEDGFFYETLRGEVVGLPAGAPLSGDRLERPLVDLLREWGTDDIDIACPDTPAVAVSTVVVCAGEVDGYEWTGVVVFEDSEGSFAVVEL